MSGWGFWEWLTYGCIGVSALMLAFDQAVKQSRVATRGLLDSLKSPLWAFTPFVLMSISAFVILARFTVMRDDISTPHNASQLPQQIANQPSEQKEAPIATNLVQLSNEDIRSTAYVLKSRVDDFVMAQIRKQINIEDSKKSSDDKASAKLQLDAQSSREFKKRFQDDILRVISELQRRLRIVSDPGAVELTTGTINLGSMSFAGSQLVSLAAKLP